MRSPLDSIAAAYVLLGLALLFFSAGFAWFLHEQGIRPIRRILRILEFPAFKVVFLLSLVAGVVHYAVSKEDGSPPQDDPPLFLSPRLSLGPRPEHLDPPDESLLPVWTNAVTNLLLTGIAMTTNGVALGAACPPSADYRSFDIWATADLSLPSWEIVGFSEFPSGVNRHEVLIPYDQLPPDFQERGFFGLEVSFDSDRDGLPDSVESALDTDPYDYDTDGDGLPDGVEASWIEVGAGELDGLPDGVGTEITASGQTSGLSPFDLPFPFRLAGENVTTAVVDLRGAVYLGGEGLTNGLAGVGISSMDGNSARDFATVAGYLTQLKMRQTLGSKIRFGTTGSDEELRFVVEFEHMGFVANATNEVSFRVVFYAARPDVVVVRYGTAFDSGRDEYTSIGARGGHDENGFNKPHLPVYYGKTPSVTEGDVYVYHFGMGGDPLLTDTDADDVDDGEEYENGTHPRRTDSDEDGLPDRWEIDYGLDPLSADGAQGAAGDFDADGVLNIEELAYDTDPSNADSDGDGLSDGEELGRIVRVASDWTVPYFTSTNLTANFSDPDDGFIGCRLPCGIRLQGEVVTNVIIDVNGILYFPRIGTAPSLSSLSSGTLYEDFGKDVFALALLWQDLYLTTNAPAPYVRMFRTEGGTNDCVVIEYGQVCPCTNRSRTGTVSVASVQVLLPISGEGGIRVNYTDVEGPLVDGRLATIGFRGFGYGEPAAGLLAAPRPPRVNEPGDGWTNVYCDDERGAVTNGLSLLFLPGTGSDPNASDTDGDGVSDLAETIYGSSAISSDTDRDGMPDPWEIHYEFDSADPSDAAHDEDEDGLTNVGEYQRGTNPINPDSDSDGLFDGLEIVHGTDPKRSDTDCDGLSDGDEVSLGANPLQPDTDGDGLDDGWEQRYDGAVVGSPGPQTTVPAGTSVPFDPTDDNRTDSDVNNDPDADPDGDGLSNAEECSCGSNPCSPDTDNDGVADAEEVSQGSDPTDPTDGGNPNSRVAVSFCFGDHSGSHSEKYKLIVKPIDGRGTRPATFSRVNAQYGECETRTVCLKPGWSYEVRLFHSGTKENEETDYDYTLQLTGEVPANVIVVDEDSLFGVDETSDTFAGEGKVARLYVLGQPKLVFDYDRDGKIDDADVAQADAGKVFRFWINDDNDSGDTNDSANDIPGSGPNHSNGHVDGRCDLLDFTPVWIDISEVFPPGTPSSVLNDVGWVVRSTCANAVWSYADRGNAGAFQRQGELYDFGSTLTDIPEGAAVATNLVEGALLPQVMMRAMRTDPDKGVFLIEGCAAGTNLVVEGWYSAFPEPAVSNCAKICITPVEGMYRWLCLRAVCGDDDGLGDRLDNPTNWPDDECDERHFVFVHGYNVNAQSARGWASEMFKRLWQSGSQSKFTAVDWYGDESQIWSAVPAIGGKALDYYINVRHALDTASALQSALSSLPGDKVMLAHSLGNMLVSAAAKDYGLQYEKYYMLNAAVPMEAYDSEVENEEMYEHGWTDVSPDKWAVNWYTHIPYVNDPRRSLKWKGRFAGIRNAVNCYSPTEEVLGNATANGYGGVWSIQELYKGTAALHFIPGNCEGGWGYNGDRTNLAGLLTEFAKTNSFTDAELVASPIFRRFDNGLLHQTNRISIAQTELNKVMGDGIPAVSFAAGANETAGVEDNYNYQNENGTPSGWPMQRQARRGVTTIDTWLHSDIANVAFFYVYKLFEKVAKGE